METMKMMLVDDEERFLQTTSKLLQKKGFDVVTARNGFEALDLLEKKLIHVVILDVKMPGMDGTEALKEIRRRFPLVDVIMLTGHATMDATMDGLTSGAIDYLMKPVSVEDLIMMAESAFARRQTREGKSRSAQTSQSPDDTENGTDEGRG